MGRRQIGTVSQLFRYPVKSMLGESLDSFAVGDKGVVGDRAWALREQSGRITSAKKWANLFAYRAAYETAPEHDGAAPVRITPPDGRPTARQIPMRRRCCRLFWAGRSRSNEPKPTNMRAARSIPKPFLATSVWSA